MPSAQPVAQQATLHDLTERLASHSRINPFMGMTSAFPGAFSTQAMSAAANAYRQPAPPPSLPNVPIYTRHQDQGLQDVPKTPEGTILHDGKLRCPRGKLWGGPDDHEDKRSAALTDEEMSRFIQDMGIVMRREYDCFVEHCWTEAFHYLFTRTIPTLIIHLIMQGTTPAQLRRQILQVGPVLDRMVQDHFLTLLHTELENRLAGSRPSMNDVMSKPTLAIPTMPQPPQLTDVGVCFHNLLYMHDPQMEEDDHGLCLCHLTTCPTCFSSAAKARKGAYSLLPFALSRSPVAKGWSGGFESEAQAQARQEYLRPKPTVMTPIPPGQGFVKNPKPENPPSATARPPPLFPHPQMTDVLAVEEHLRWRLKEMGASDPAVEARYGPCTNSPAALDGIDSREDTSEDGDALAMSNGHNKPKGKPVQMTKGKGGKGRRPVNGTVGGAKKPTPAKTKHVLLPRQWIDADPQERNMAIILTFRHLIKLLHQVTVSVSPFAYKSYAADIEILDQIQPLALYRRLAERSVQRQAQQHDMNPKLWSDCMDKWGEEQAAREKAEGNKFVTEQRWAEAVTQYTRAISLDPRKTIFYSNRAVSLNALGEFERAEADCKWILSRDAKNPKAFYQRAVARMGLEKWREAESDIKEVLRQQGDNAKAKQFLETIKKEVAKLPKQSREEVLNF